MVVAVADRATDRAWIERRWDPRVRDENRGDPTKIRTRPVVVRYKQSRTVRRRHCHYCGRVRCCGGTAGDCDTVDHQIVIVSFVDIFSGVVVEGPLNRSDSVGPVGSVGNVVVASLGFVSRLVSVAS